MNALALAQETLAAISELPPSSLLALATENQAAHWLNLRRRYVGVSLALGGYFLGQECPELEQIDPVMREFFLLQRDRWLGFYKVVLDSWGKFPQTLKQDLADSGILTPGDALKASIENEALHQMSESFKGYARWTPNQTRQRFKSFRASLRGALTPVKQKQVTTDLRRMAAEQAEFRQLDWILLDEFEAIAKKDARTRENLRQFKQSESALISFLESQMLHERKQLKGHEWRSGQRFQTAKKGGAAL